ncbi:MAG: hypothetical protein QOC81_3926 [Thermoanaerobaculia bacterium]|nr:hypothetical protein [Thermoanaerobaculia bacterium]
MTIALLLLGILLPAALLVAGIRRWIAPVPWPIALLFMAMTLAFLHGAVFTSRLPVPVDEVARGYPWHGLFGDVIAANPLTNDTVKLFLPWMQVAREELSHGRAPLWNRYAFAGYPLLANGESAPFSPLFLATLIVPLPKQIVAMAALKIFSALLFTFLFLKRENVSDAAAVFGAVVFSFSTLMTVFLYYSTASVVAFLPAAAFALLHAIDRQTKSSIVLVAIVIATLLANGHPESVLHIAVGCGGILAIELLLRSRGLGVAQFRGTPPSETPRDLATPRPRDLLRPLAGVAAGLALGAPSWVPVLEQVLLSERFASLRQTVPVQQLPFTAAWAIISPNGFGNPVRHNWSWVGHYVGVAISYAGLLPLALVLAAVLWRRTENRERLRIALAVVLFLVAMDWTFLGHALNAIPPFNIAANDKLRFVCIFLIAIVAAKTLNVSRTIMAIASAPIVGLAIYVYAKRSDLMRPIDLLGVAAIVVFLALPQRFRGWGAVALVFVELCAFNNGFNALVDGKYFRPPLPIVDALRAHAPREPFRVAGISWTLLPNAAAQYGLEDVRGSDPMAFATYDHFLRRFTSPDLGWIPLIANANRPELNFLNVRFLFGEPDASPGGVWRLIYRGVDGTLWENPAVLPRFFARSASVTNLQSSAPAEFTMTVVASAPALVESSEVLAPGRRVYVGGRSVPLRHIDETFIGFEVPAGTSEVRVVYRPMSFYGSIVIALLAVLALWFWPVRVPQKP